MQFSNIHYLWLLWLIPLLVLFYLWAWRRKNTLLARFVSAQLRARLLLEVSPQRQRFKMLLVLLAVVGIVLALIRPQYGFHWEEVQSRGVDIVIALDVSKSMLAEDVSPNRLERAKREIIDFLELVQGDRIGLVAFAGEGFLQCPLTLDYGAVRIFLDDLDTDLIPVPGTAIGQAISKGIAAFDQEDKRSRVMILITDGEDHEGDPPAMAEKAKEQQVKIFAIGIGKEEGAPIPAGGSRGGFMKNSAGELILSKLNQGTLEKIASTTGGSFKRATTGNLELEQIYRSIRAEVGDKELLSGRRKQFEERFQWPLSLALCCLFAELLLRETRRNKARRWWLLAFIVFLPSPRGGKLDASPLIADNARQGEQAFREQKFPEARQHYLDALIAEPNNWQLKFNTADAYYRTGEYEKAAQLFKDIAEHGPADLAAKSQYNWGNSAFRQEKLEDAVKAYQKALDLDPKDQDAQENLAFVQEKQKQKQKQQDQNKQDQNKQDQNKQDQNKQDQNKQDQNKQDQNKQDQNKQDQQDKNGSKEEQQKQQDQDKQEQDKNGSKEEQQKQQEQAKKDQGKGEEQPQQQGQDKKNENNNERQDQQKEDNQEQKQGQEKPANGESSAEQRPVDQQKISEEEALRWLSTMQGDRKEYLKKKFKGSKQRNVEKNW